MDRKIALALTLIVLVSSAISFSLLTRGHIWADDFAGYLLQTKSIRDGKMTEFVNLNNFVINQSTYPPGPVAYPWGFPLLLLPAYVLLGLNTLVLKLLNTVFYALFLFFFFRFARTRLENVEAILLTATLAFNPTLLSAHDYIISDIPFLFFSTLTVFLIDKSSHQKSSVVQEAALGLAIFGASFVRTNGILLFVPFVVTQWMGRQYQEPKQRLPSFLQGLLVPFFTFGVFYSLQALIFPNVQDTYLSHFSMFSAQRLWDNFLYYLWLPADAFGQIPGGAILYPVLLLFIVISILQQRGRDLAIHAYTLATIFLFIIWPERQGLRFLYPTLPFLFVFGYDGIKLIVARLRENWQNPARIAVGGFWTLLAVISLGISGTSAYNNLTANRTINGPFDPISAEMFEYVREKIRAQSVVIFFKPRTMLLFTGRLSFMTDRCEDLAAGNFLVLSEKVGDNGQVPPEKVKLCTGIKTTQVFNNRRFTIYKIDAPGSNP